MDEIELTIEERLNRLNADSIVCKQSFFYINGPWTTSFAGNTILNAIILAENALGIK
jgi:hypothetical protein